MIHAKRSPRSSRRGSILGMSMLFFVMVTVAGAAIMSMSTIQRIKTVRNGIDVRLMIAAEAGIESVRGRFTLVQGVQDDWNFLNSTTWTTVEVVSVNGMNVTVEGMLFGGPSVPTARLRSTAASGVKSRTVEYMIKVASFSDYAVFTSGAGNPGQNYKLVGNIFMAGNLNIGYDGVQFFGRTQMTGIVNKTGVAAGVPDTYTFPIRNPEPLSIHPGFPNEQYRWDVLLDRATSTGHIWAENTLEIELMGSQMRRTFVRRTAAGVGNGTAPDGITWNGAGGWCNPANGATNYAHAHLNNLDYIVVQEVIDIPDEGVIYIRSGAARDAQATDPGKDALGGNRNTFTQQVSGNDILGTDARIFTDRGTGQYTPVTLISGWLDDRRVSIATDNKFVVKQPIVYQELLNNPSLRTYYNDSSHPTGKQSQPALNFKEMLGVMARGDIHPCVTWWNNINTIYGTGGVAYDAVTPEFLPPPRVPDDTYCMDGVYLALGDTSPWRHNNNGTGEMWFHGGLIGQIGYGGGNANRFLRRQYDWDFRMALTMPPYFLHTYNVSATFVPGTWRTWEN